MIEPSVLSLIAAALYLALAAMLGRTGWQARNFLQSGHDYRFWFMAAVIFCLLALSRIFAAEELLRVYFRALLDSGSLYADRQQIQLPLAAFTLGVSALLAWAWLRGWRRAAENARKQAILLAWAGLGAMAALITLRMISLHAIDSWLYAGPRLNWWIDPGACLLVALAAWRYLITLPRPGR